MNNLLIFFDSQHSSDFVAYTLRKKKVLNA